MFDRTKIIAFVPTTDAGRARAFYEGVLELRFVKDDGFAHVYDANGNMLRIAKAPEFKAAKFTILGWEVPNIAVTAERLHERGVRFERFGLPGQDERGIWTAPNGDKVAWFKDPDENILSISEHV
jgi:catechol 2,3-dioxygenase-like lactoylglutathione lyase family enzyme